MTGTVMLYLLVAGIAKALDVPTFATQVLGWGYFSTAASVAVAIVLPAGELCLAMAWFLGLYRRRVEALAGIMLIVFTVLYALLLFAGKSPSCGCLGILRQWEGVLESGPGVIVRNGILMALLVVGYWLSMLTQRLDAADVKTSGFVRERQLGTRAFTLVEVAVCILVAGLLLALLLPSLERSRARSKVAVSLANMKSHGAIFAQYSADWRDAMPVVLDPGTPRSVVSNTMRDFKVELYYFQSYLSWNIALASHYYNGEHTAKVFRSPEEDGGTSVPALFSSYWYSCAFFADPAYWNYTTRTSPAQWRGTRVTEIVFPSRKSLLLSSPLRERSEGRDALRLLFCDLSASAVDRGRVAGLSYSAGDGGWEGAVHGTASPPTMHTYDGARGSDVMR